MTPIATIVIPVFNRWDLTKQCLDTLGQTLKDQPVEIIVVDNASTDGTWDNLFEYSNGLTITGLRNAKNENFSGACNRGADAAKSEYIVFLNNDTIPFEGWLDPLLQELKKGTAIVGSKLCFPNGTIQHAGVCYMRETRFPYHPYRDLSVETPQVNRRRECQAVTGACFAITKHWFYRGGKFKTEFKNGGEDIELCTRVFAEKGSIVYRHDSVLVHLESQSPGRLDYNEQNVKTFYDMTKDYSLADEDWFYWQDGYHRVGDRTLAVSTDLAPFTSTQEQKLWRTVCDVEIMLAMGYSKEVTGLLAAQAEWPEDAAVREWAGLTARKLKQFEAATEHFYTAAKIRAWHTAQDCATRAVNGINLNPIFNRYFAE